MNNITESKRTIYNPSDFAKKSLIYLQEVGKTKTLSKHTSKREKLDSYLFFIVLDGSGALRYNNQEHKLDKGSCVFIDCNNKYSHTSDNWTIEWIHFYGENMKDIYDKYLGRNGKPVFYSHSYSKYETLIDEIQTIADSNDFIKDMNIYERIVSLLSLLMNETVYESEDKKRIYDIDEIKKYIDSNYLNDISLDELSGKFYINKFYLTRLFKETYGLTIKEYILSKRISKAKEMLRYDGSSIEDIGIACGISDPNYFSRVFKKIEGITPNMYRKLW